MSRIANQRAITVADDVALMVDVDEAERDLDGFGRDTGSSLSCGGSRSANAAARSSPCRSKDIIKGK
jgi:hypothetical protein